MNVNNLTNVYNNNPTLQGSYTLQQYLDLFGGSSTGTTTPTTTATTPTTTNSSQGIINANINQFQNQGGGNDGYTGFGDFGNLDKSSMKEFNMPGFDNPVKGYKNTSTGLYQDLQGKNIQNLGIGSFGVMGLIEKAFGLDKKDPKYAGLFDKVNYKALMKNPSLYKSFFDRQDVAKQKKIQEAVDRANRIELAKLEQERQAKANLAGLSSTTTQGGGGGIAGGGFNASKSGGGSQQAQSGGQKAGGSGRTDGGWGWAKGGFVRGSYFNGGIAGFKNGGRINFRGGGMDMGNASNQAQSASMGSSKSSTNQGPAGGASSGGNYGGNRNPKQTYGGGGGPKPGSGRVNTVNRFGPKNLSFFDKINIHSANNAKLEKAYRDKVISGDEYNVLGGLSSKRDLGFGPVKTAAASTAYNLVQSALGPKFSRGNQPLFEGALDIGRNTFGSTLDPNSALAQQYDEIMNTYKSGGRVEAKDGGSMTQIVKDRLMDKNPAMWGLGYEGLASLQDLIMSIPFNQGGIVNIRRR
jgi:hypothetical protein